MFIKYQFYCSHMYLLTALFKKWKMFISALVQVFMSVQPDGLVQGVWATRLSKLGPTVGSARSASSTMATG